MSAIRLLIVTFAVCFLGLNPLGAEAESASRTYTTDADFDEGLLINVNHDAPNNDQLQLNETPGTLPFVHMALSERGTVARLDSETGEVLGEYLTAPDGRGRNPSRTTVDLRGNVWVANRDEVMDGMGSVVRIGLVLGGTRVNAAGDPDPQGEYLKPPFLYNTCVDRDGDGLIRTSRGLGDFLPWDNAGLADGMGGVSTALDECITAYTRVTGTGTRTVAVDGNNDIWVGGTGDLDHELLDGETALPIPGTQINRGCGGYGGLVDGNGVLWSSRGSGFPPLLLRLDPGGKGKGSFDCLDASHGDYGLGIDPRTGNIWHTNLNDSTIVELWPSGEIKGTYNHGDFFAQGCAVDGNGNVWVAHSNRLGGATTVGRLRTDGTFVGKIELPGGVGPTGVAVDNNGKIWVSSQLSHNAHRIDPNAGILTDSGFPLGEVDLVVDLKVDGMPLPGPYNYSDMTGFVAFNATAPRGTWTVVYDSEEPGAAWGTASWNSEEPEGTEVYVEVRAAEDPIGLAGETFVRVGNDVSFSGISGRYIEIQTTLRRELMLGPDGVDVGVSPVLFDLTIESRSGFLVDVEVEDVEGCQGSILEVPVTVRHDADGVRDLVLSCILDGVPLVDGEELMAVPPEGTVVSVFVPCDVPGIQILECTVEGMADDGKTMVTALGMGTVTCLEACVTVESVVIEPPPAGPGEEVELPFRITGCADRPQDIDVVCTVNGQTVAEETLVGVAPGEIREVTAGFVCDAPGNVVVECSAFASLQGETVCTAEGADAVTVLCEGDECPVCLEVTIGDAVACVGSMVDVFIIAVNCEDAPANLEVTCLLDGELLEPDVFRNVPPGEARTSVVWVPCTETRESLVECTVTSTLVEDPTCTKVDQVSARIACLEACVELEAGTVSACPETGRAEFPVTVKNCGEEVSDITLECQVEFGSIAREPLVFDAVPPGETRTASIPVLCRPNRQVEVTCTALAEVSSFPACNAEAMVQGYVSCFQEGGALTALDVTGCVGREAKIPVLVSHDGAAPCDYEIVPVAAGMDLEPVWVEDVLPGEERWVEVPVSCPLPGWVDVRLYLNESGQSCLLHDDARARIRVGKCFRPLEELQEGGVPLTLGLRAFPNPLRGGEATLLYGISAYDAGRGADLTVYDVSGRLVRRLSAEDEAGWHAAVWDLKDHSGAPVGSGVYFYRLRAGREQTTQRLLVVR